MTRVKKNWVCWLQAGRESLYCGARALHKRAVRAGSASRVESLVGRPYRQLVVGSAGGDISTAG